VDESQVMGLKVSTFAAFIKQPVQGVFVEIGSDRGQGSTKILADLAQQFGSKLITVDISDRAKQQWATFLPLVEFVVQKGSEWAESFSGCISCLFLDNYDYAKSPNEVAENDWIWQTYSKHCNHESQLEHFKQIMALEPKMATNAIICCDDTYLANGVWVGKCGPAVSWLLIKKWHIVDIQAHGVILSRD
jgi:hypothetical protein